MSEPQYRILRAGERIKAGDEADRMVNPFKDEPSWVPVNPTSIGKIAPDPAYPAHTLYRRRIENDPMPYETPSQPGSKIELKECKLRQLPNADELEPAAREYIRLMGGNPDYCSLLTGQPAWMSEVYRLRDELARRWALDVFERSVSQTANGETQTDLTSTGETRGETNESQRKTNDSR